MSNHYQDELGDRCKYFEQEPNSRLYIKGLPLIARLDGKAFHTFTKSLNRPYDTRLMKCMQETVEALVAETNAILGYTQSDEITLIWHYEDEKSELLFNGKQQKLTSILASMATIYFYKNVLKYLPEKIDKNPMFDCRVWPVPSKKDAIDVLKWREWDAVKNSITMLASHYYSHKELHEKGSREKQDMIHAKGDNWNNHPDHFKRGLYVHRVLIERELTEEELEKIPTKNRPTPGTKFIRSHIIPWELPPITKIKNIEDVVFKGAEVII
jgi:tRNA(His) 5'-end guanylyltransferase